MCATGEDTAAPGSDQSTARATAEISRTLEGHLGVVGGQGVDQLLLASSSSLLSLQVLEGP